MSENTAQAKSAGTLGSIVAAIALGWMVIAMLGRHTTAQDEDREPFSTRDWLDVCSPFLSYDGRRMLEFHSDDNQVTLSDASAGEIEPSKTILDVKNPHETTGTWAVNEKSKTVTIFLGGTNPTYSMVWPDASNGFDECFLGAGDVRSLDLTNSWFGTVTPNN